MGRQAGRVEISSASARTRFELRSLPRDGRGRAPCSGTGAAGAFRKNGERSPRSTPRRRRSALPGSRTLSRAMRFGNCPRETLARARRRRPAHGGPPPRQMCANSGSMSSSGRLSTQRYPRSSKQRVTTLFPAPERPVTTTARGTRPHHRPCELLVVPGQVLARRIRHPALPEEVLPSGRFDEKRQALPRSHGHR